MLENIRKSIENRKDKIEKISDQIWGYAELGHREVKSSRVLIQALKEENFQVEEKVLKLPTAFIARYGHGHPVIGLLGEFDALPNLSQKGSITYKEAILDGENGHGCGHNLIGSGALEAALSIKDYLDSTGKEGTVIYYGCAAEETLGAKPFFAHYGVFNECDLIYGWHPSFKNEIPATPHIGVKMKTYEFFGITSHAGSNPELGRSALDACELMNVGVNYLREHIISSARVHYAYLDVGGKAPNVVQDHAQLIYGIRAPKLDQIRDIERRIDNIAQGACLMTETKVKIATKMGYADCDYNYIVNQVLSDCFELCGVNEYSEEEKAFAKAMVDNYTEDMKKNVASFQRKYSTRSLLHDSIITFDPCMSDQYIFGSTDVGDVGYVVPTGYFFAATRPLCSAGHTWYQTSCGKSTIGYKGMHKAAEVMALAFETFVEHPELVEKAKQEWKENYEGKYECMMKDIPLPLSEDRY